MTAELNVAPFYAGWHLGNESLITVIEPLSPEQLQLPVGSPDWPVWASAAHLAGTRVYWLCGVFGEPGAETTPFADPNVGWEDDITRPRTAGELVTALETTWRIVERCLATWTPESLSLTAQRVREGRVQIHTRQSVLMRMITHDAYHCGEISLVLGSHGLGAIDLWSGLSRTV